MKEERIKLKFAICCIFLLFIILIILMILVQKKKTESEFINETPIQQVENQSIEDELITDIETEKELIQAEETENTILPEIQIKDHYITNTGTPNNLYYVDEQKILWGAGENRYGQLGVGTQDNEFHTEFVKIAENVVHVDYSGRGFAIYLTSDGKLYGMGNGGTGALQQSANFELAQYENGEEYAVIPPVLLMEDVLYARCGRDDIVAMKGASVYIWGMIWYQGMGNVIGYIPTPTKVLDGAMLVTGGIYNHAALLEDGSVWTWGYNYTGNCGVEEPVVISTPLKVAEDVVMVWTGSTTKNVECYDIIEFDKIYERGLENTIIKKSNGSYWICGLNVGEEEKELPIYYLAANFSVICTSEFLPYENEIEESTSK